MNGVNQHQCNNKLARMRKLCGIVCVHPAFSYGIYIGYRRVSVARCFEVRLTSYVGPGGPIRAGVLKVRRSYGIEGYRCF